MRIFSMVTKALSSKPAAITDQEYQAQDRINRPHTPVTVTWELDTVTVDEHLLQLLSQKSPA